MRDRLSFMYCPAGHCAAMSREGGSRASDRKTAYRTPGRSGSTARREARAGMVEAPFRQLHGHPARRGYIARGGRILDALIVPVPENRNTRDGNAAIKSGKVPEDRESKPAMRSRKDLARKGLARKGLARKGLARKDLDARWTKKHGKSRCGYRNHVNVDRKHKPVRRHDVTDAAVHDGRAVDHLPMRGNTGAGVRADSACRSGEMEAKLRDRKLTGHIHRKGKRGKPLTRQARGSNRTRSTVRVRVEHVFGAQANDMGGTPWCARWACCWPARRSG